MSQEQIKDSTEFKNFLDAYVTSLLWVSLYRDNSPTEYDQTFSDTGSFDLDSFEQDSKDTIVNYCLDFYINNYNTILDAINTGKVAHGPDFDEWGRAGHDFCMETGGHGCGFWDGDWPEPYASQLSKNIKRKEVFIWMNNKNKIVIE